MLAKLRPIADALMSVWGAAVAYTTLIGVVAIFRPEAAAGTRPALWFVLGLVFLSVAYDQQLKKLKRSIRKTRSLIENLEAQYSPRLVVALHPRRSKSYDTQGIPSRRDGYAIAIRNPGTKIVSNARVYIEDRYGWGADRLLRISGAFPPRIEPTILPILSDHCYLLADSTWLYTADLDTPADQSLPRMRRMSHEMSLRIEGDGIVTHLLLDVCQHGDKAAITIYDRTNQLEIGPDEVR